MRRIVAPVLTLTLATLASATASARPHKVEIGIGAAGFMNGSFMSEPAEDKKLVTVEGTDPQVQAKVPYPGFWGLAGGGGVQLNAMYRGMIGMELDLLFSVDKGAGQITLNSGESNEVKVNLTMSQGAFHIPLLVKAAIPLKSVRPFVLLGPEFVLPGDPELTTDLEISPEIKAEAGPYINLQTGFGFEFQLPVSGVDLRVPLSFRGNINFDTPEGLNGRVKLTEVTSTSGQPSLKSINSEWEYQAFITLGLTWYQYVD